MGWKDWNSLKLRLELVLIPGFILRVTQELSQCHVYLYNTITTTVLINVLYRKVKIRNEKKGNEKQTG